MRAATFNLLIFISSVTFVSAAPYKRAISCPPINKAKAPLLTQGSIDPSNGISCQYEGDFCAYFSNGSFSAGSSACPEFLSERKDLETPKTLVPVQVVCPAVDNEDRPLIEQGKTDNPTNGVICQYDRQFCIYFDNGSFSSGSSACPVSITPGGLNPGSAKPTGLIRLDAESVVEPETLIPVQVVCPAVDNEDRPLIEQGKTDNPTNGVICQYDRQFCIYFNNGSFSSGSSACPISITPMAAQPILADDKPIALPPSTKVCPQQDKKHNTLAVQGATNDPINGVTCKYTNGPICAFFRSGAFSSGSSVCPFALID